MSCRSTAIYRWMRCCARPFVPGKRLNLMRDIPAVLWLRWRQFRDSAVYWLRVLGYQPNEKSISQNLYVVYLGLIGLLWFGAMWTFVYDTANNLGSLLPQGSLAQLLQLLPYVGLAMQVYVMVNALRSTP